MLQSTHKPTAALPDPLGAAPVPGATAVAAPDRHEADIEASGVVGAGSPWARPVVLSKGPGVGGGLLAPSFQVPPIPLLVRFEKRSISKIIVTLLLFRMLW